MMGLGSTFLNCIEEGSCCLKGYKVSATNGNSTMIVPAESIALGIELHQLSCPGLYYDISMCSVNVYFLPVISLLGQ